MTISGNAMTEGVQRREKIRGDDVERRVFLRQAGLSFAKAQGGDW